MFLFREAYPKKLYTLLYLENKAQNVKKKVSSHA
jgi:hypothetical protein